jgi:hypothetical protein
MSTAPQSNQNAGADERSCPWCSLWNVAFAAEKLQPKQYGAHSTRMNYRVWQLQDHAESVLILLANRDTNCPGCQRSAEIYLGDYLGDERREWRWKLVEDNSTNRALFKLGPDDWKMEGAGNAG